MKLGWECSALAFECQQVIALRLAKLSRGGAAASREANRMVSEKLAALVQTGMGAAKGRLTAFSHKAIPENGARSNRRRLAK